MFKLEIRLGVTDSGKLRGQIDIRRLDDGLLSNFRNADLLD
jgi:hypothetical protein